MRWGIRRGTITILGGVFILIGISGLVLPFLQGILFIVIGVYILSLEFQWLRKRMERLEARHPTFNACARKVRAFFDR